MLIERQLGTVLAEYEAHYNGRRAHRSRQLRPPRPDHRIADLNQQRIRRRPVPASSPTNMSEPHSSPGQGQRPSSGTHRVYSTIAVMWLQPGPEVVRTDVRRMNAIMERWMQTCRREVLDRTLVWNHSTIPGASSAERISERVAAGRPVGIADHRRSEATSREIGAKRKRGSDGVGRPENSAAAVTVWPIWLNWGIPGCSTRRLSRELHPEIS